MPWAFGVPRTVLFRFSTHTIAIIAIKAKTPMDAPIAAIAPEDRRCEPEFVEDVDGELEVVVGSDVADVADVEVLGPAVADVPGL